MTAVELVIRDWRTLARTLSIGDGMSPEGTVMARVGNLYDLCANQLEDAIREDEANG